MYSREEEGDDESQDRCTYLHWSRSIRRCITQNIPRSRRRGWAPRWRPRKPWKQWSNEIRQLQKLKVDKSPWVLQHWNTSRTWNLFSRIFLLSLPPKKNKGDWEEGGGVGGSHISDEILGGLTITNPTLYHKKPSSQNKCNTLVSH